MYLDAWCVLLRRGDKVTRVVMLEIARINNNSNQLYSMKCMIIPVITGAFGTVPKVYRNIWKPYQENIQ